MRFAEDPALGTFRSGGRDPGAEIRTVLSAALQQPGVGASIAREFFPAAVVILGGRSSGCSTRASTPTRVA
jgi:hypothetical protein